jgi:hypothetical protein
MNRWFHYEMESAEDWHQVGNKLAPKEFWNPLLEKPGLRSMAIQGRRTGSDSGNLYVKIEPSLIVQPGVFIDVTEEFVSTPDASAVDAQWVPSHLDKHWDNVMNYAEGVGQGLLTAVAKS